MYRNIKTRRRELPCHPFFFACVCLLGALLLISASPAAAENAGGLTIVSVDTGKILEAHPAFVQAKKDFETELQDMQKQLKDMNEEEQMMAQQKMQQQIQQRGEQLQKEALKEMKKDLKKIADEKGYDYVFDANSLIVGGKDVTDEVLKAMKAQGNQKKNQ